MLQKRVKPRNLDRFSLVEVSKALNGALSNEIVLVGKQTMDLIVQLGENLISCDLKSSLSYPWTAVLEIGSDSTKKLVPIVNREGLDGHPAIFDGRPPSLRSRCRGLHE